MKLSRLWGGHARLWFFPLFGKCATISESVQQFRRVCNSFGASAALSERVQPLRRVCRIFWSVSESVQHFGECAAFWRVCSQVGVYSPNSGFKHQGLSQSESLKQQSVANTNLSFSLHDLCYQKVRGDFHKKYMLYHRQSVFVFPCGTRYLGVFPRK